MLVLIVTMSAWSGEEYDIYKDVHCMDCLRTTNYLISTGQLDLSTPGENANEIFLTVNTIDEILPIIRVPMLGMCDSCIHFAAELLVYGTSHPGWPAFDYQQRKYITNFDELAEEIFNRTR